MLYYDKKKRCWLSDQSKNFRVARETLLLLDPEEWENLTFPSFIEFMEWYYDQFRSVKHGGGIMRMWKADLRNKAVREVTEYGESDAYIAYCGSPEEAWQEIINYYEKEVARARLAFNKCIIDVADVKSRADKALKNNKGK